MWKELFQKRKADSIFLSICVIAQNRTIAFVQVGGPSMLFVESAGINS
jgi:hypothetical protein